VENKNVGKKVYFNPNDMFAKRNQFTYSGHTIRKTKENACIPRKNGVF